jgi:hypothetical protein
MLNSLSHKKGYGMGYYNCSIHFACYDCHHVGCCTTTTTVFSLGYFIIDDKRSMLSNCRSSMNLMHVSQMNSTFLKESPKTSSLWE